VTESEREAVELLFNLANVDRLELLREIDKSKSRLSTLAKRIDVTAQECFRHLVRLSDSGMIAKDREGAYQTTPLGKTILNLLPALQFLLEYKDYFKQHDLSLIPNSMVERIGELAGGEYLNHTSKVIDHLMATISGAKKYVWIAADQPVKIGRRIGENFSSHELPVRLICEPGITNQLLAETKSNLPNSEVRILQSLNTMVAMNEVVAGVFFPGLNSKLDFCAGFSGKDIRFREWCADLFENFWSRSKPSYGHLNGSEK